MAENPTKKNTILAIELFRSNQKEKYSPFELSIWRKTHDYNKPVKISFFSGRSPNRAKRLTELFVGWMVRCGETL